MDQSDVDRAALRILRSIYAHGLADHPVVAGQPIAFESHATLARDVAESGMVLLKNDGDILPLAATAGRIAVIGGYADVGVVAGGGGSPQVYPAGGPALALPVAGEPPNRRQFFARSSPLGELRAILPQASVVFDDGSDPTRASRVAASADIAIVFAQRYSTEDRDIRDLSLGGGQDALIEAVSDANSRTIVVLQTSGAILMPWLDRVPAVIAAWYPGQRGGDAIARVLTGMSEPGGRLPITYPAALDQLPNPALPGADIIPDNGSLTFYAAQMGLPDFEAQYPEGADVGYGWFERTGATPLFAFGHGLSYTSFAYEGLELTGGDTIVARFSVANTGDRHGSDVAQLYVRVDGVRRLVGWQKISLAPGEERELIIRAEPRLLARFDVEMRDWVIEESEVDVEIGRAIDNPVLHGVENLSARRFD